MLLATPAASAVPSTVTTSPYRLATPLRGTPLAGPRPRPHAPASGLGAGPGLRVQPRAPSLCALSGARAIRGPAPARLQRVLPSCWRSSTPNHSVHIRGKGGQGHREAWAGGRCDRLGQGQAPLAEPGLPRSPGRGAGAWPSAAGTGARPAPPRPAQDPLLLWNGSGGQGLASAPGPAQGGPAPALIGLRRGVNCQPMWRGRQRWRLLK